MPVGPAQLDPPCIGRTRLPSGRRRFGKELFDHFFHVAGVPVPGPDADQPHFPLPVDEHRLRNPLDQVILIEVVFLVDHCDAVLQFVEGLSDRRAADAVRGRIDWR